MPMSICKRSVGWQIILERSEPRSTYVTTMQDELAALALKILREGHIGINKILLSCYVLVCGGWMSYKSVGARKRAKDCPDKGTRPESTQNRFRSDTRWAL